MNKTITIVKVGGAIVEDHDRLAALLDRFAALEGWKILVHGGGRRATAVAGRLGIESKMVGGRRVTDGQMLDVVTMVYGGLVNKQIVAQLQARGVNALGLTGADLDVVRSHRRPVTNGVDYGFVGDVDRVDAGALLSLLKSGAVPVMAPLTHDGRSQMLNTNADTIAAQVARALAHEADVTLVYCFERAGVLRNPDDDGSVIPVITRADFDRLVAEGIISGGMRPKVENALSAVADGVSRVVITRSPLIDGQSGTIIK